MLSGTKGWREMPLWQQHKQHLKSNDKWSIPHYQILEVTHQHPQPCPQWWSPSYPYGGSMPYRPRSDRTDGLGVGWPWCTQIIRRRYQLGCTGREVVGQEIESTSNFAGNDNNPHSKRRLAFITLDAFHSGYIRDLRKNVRISWRRWAIWFI